MEVFDHKGAIAAFEKAAALDANSAELLASYTSAVETGKTALASALSEAQKQLAEGKAVVSTQDWESAIALFEAGLAVRGTHDAALTGSLTHALKDSKRFMNNRDNARSEAERNFADGTLPRTNDLLWTLSCLSALVCCSDNATVTICDVPCTVPVLCPTTYTPWTSIQGVCTFHTLLLSDSVACINSTDRWSIYCRPAGNAAMADVVRDYPVAIAAFRAGLELDVQSEELTARLKKGLVDASVALEQQETARAEAATWAANAEACMAVYDHKGAIAAYEHAQTFDVNDEKLMRTFLGGTLSAKRALATALENARGKLSDGQFMVGKMNWEGAIEVFGEGLQVQGTHDDELTASLTEAKANAEAGLEARDLARHQGEGHYAEGVELLADRLYEGCIDTCQAGLSLDTQSPPLKAKLQKMLAKAKAGLAAQAAARAEAERIEREEGARTPDPFEAEAKQKADELLKARGISDIEKLKMMQQAELARQDRQAEQLQKTWDEVDEDGSGNLVSSHSQSVRTHNLPLLCEGMSQV